LPAFTGLSWGWLRLQSIHSTELATLLVLRSLSGLGQWLTFEVFALSNFPEDATLPGTPLVAFCSPPEFCCTDAAIHEVEFLDGCLPCGFFPLRRLPGSGQPLILEGTSLQVRALSAFRTPSGPFSARDLPALFHAGPALGVRPSGSISTRRADHPLGYRALSRLGALLVFRPGHLGFPGS
jgi:hypothetical protein